MEEGDQRRTVAEPSGVRSPPRPAALSRTWSPPVGANQCKAVERPSGVRSRLRPAAWWVAWSPSVGAFGFRAPAEWSGAGGWRRGGWGVGSEEARPCRRSNPRLLCLPPVVVLPLPGPLCVGVGTLGNACDGVRPGPPGFLGLLPNVPVGSAALLCRRYPFPGNGRPCWVYRRVSPECGPRSCGTVVPETCFRRHSRGAVPGRGTCGGPGSPYPVLRKRPPNVGRGVISPHMVPRVWGT